MLAGVSGCFVVAGWLDLGAATEDWVGEPQGSLGVMVSSAVGVGMAGKGPGSSKLYQLARGSPLGAVLACKGRGEVGNAGLRYWRL